MSIRFFLLLSGIVIFWQGNAQTETVDSTVVDSSAVESIPAFTNVLSDYKSFDKAEAIMNGFLRKWGLAGATVAVTRHDQLIYAKGLGYADKEKGILASPTNTFRVASVSKLITAIAIMKLVEEGKLTVEDKVFGKGAILDLPIYKDFSDKRFSDITVRHLLIHEGGWHSKYGDHLFMPHYIARYMNSKLPISDETIIRFALKKGLHFIPGTAISYSNLGYCILGKVIEQLSGMSYEQYVNAAVLEPLGIYGMHITSNKFVNKPKREVKYYDAPGSKTRLSVYNSTSYAPKCYEGTDFETLGAAGGWSASGADLLRILAAVNGRSPVEDLLTCSSIDSMTILPSPDKFGFGWVHCDTLGNWWRTGTLSGTSAFMMHRSDGISFTFVTNTSTWRGSKFAYDIKEMMLQALETIDWWPTIDLFPYWSNAELEVESMEEN
jgi:CubicO group peptidase (beta-lactamase class C family)